MYLVPRSRHPGLWAAGAFGICVLVLAGHEAGVGIAGLLQRLLEGIWNSVDLFSTSIPIRIPWVFSSFPVPKEISIVPRAGDKTKRISDGLEM